MGSTGVHTRSGGSRQEGDATITDRSLVSVGALFWGTQAAFLSPVLALLLVWSWRGSFMQPLVKWRYDESVILHMLTLTLLCPTVFEI